MSILNSTKVIKKTLSGLQIFSGWLANWLAISSRVPYNEKSNKFSNRDLCLGFPRSETNYWTPSLDYPHFHTVSILCWSLLRVCLVSKGFSTISRSLLGKNTSDVSVTTPSSLIKKFVGFFRLRKESIREQKKLSRISKLLFVYSYCSVF